MHLCLSENKVNINNLKGVQNLVIAIKCGHIKTTNGMSIKKGVTKKFTLPLSSNIETQNEKNTTIKQLNQSIDSPSSELN